MRTDRTKAASDPHLVQLDEAECGNLLRVEVSGGWFFGLGKASCDSGQFKMLKEIIVFRSASDGEIVDSAPKSRSVSKSTRIDDAMSEGWSVLAAGTIHRVQPPAQLHEVEALDIEPWAGGERNTYFCLRVTGLRGRKINAVR